MSRLKSTLAVLFAVSLLALAVAPAAAAAQGDATPQTDECKNADQGPGDDGGPPEGLVGSVTPDFLGDLFSDLPVPNFVKSMFGAQTC